MRTIKNGLIQILSPVILTGNIHGRDWDIHMTGQTTVQNMGSLNLSSKKDSDVKVAYTVDLKEMLNKLDNDSWNPAGL